MRFIHRDKFNVKDSAFVRG